MAEYVRVVVTKGMVLRLPKELADRLVSQGEADYEDDQTEPAAAPAPESIEEVSEDG